MMLVFWPACVVCSEIAGREAMMTPSVQARSADRGVADAIDVSPCVAGLGAEVRAGCLRALVAGAFERVLWACHDHRVVLFRGQALGEVDLIAFSLRFGDLDWAPIQETGLRFVEGMPE